MVGANALVMLGGATVVTTKFAVAGAPVPALVDKLLPVLLTKVLVGAGALALLTVTETVQLPLGASVPALMPSVLPAATPPTKVALEPAVQLMVVFAGVAFRSTPAGEPAG